LELIFILFSIVLPLILVPHVKLEFGPFEGNLEKLRTFLLYGADAVYIGIAGLSLRSPSAEMSLADLATGVGEAHARKVKVYAAINTFARNADLKQARQIIPALVDAGKDNNVKISTAVSTTFRCF
jgi:putative protease